MNKLILISLLFLLTSCTFVRLTPAGDNVAILQMNEVSACTSVGTTTVSVVDKIGVNRKFEKVEEELSILARNRAATRGDTLVATGPVVKGEQTFNVYRCRR
jgi:acyl-CoA synthetase (AMP-forming)/AMP-acid ligase II